MRLFKWPARASDSVSRDIRYRERFEFALALSLLVHALILALRFGAAGFGLPWFEEERPQPPAMTLKRSDTLKVPEPSPETARLRADVATSPPPAKSEPRSPSAPLEVRLVQAAPPPAPASAPQRETRKPAPAAKARARDRQVRPKPAPRIIAQAKPQPDTFKVPAARRTEPEPQRAPDSAGKAQAEEQKPAEQVAEPPRRETDDAPRLEAEEAARQRAEEETRQRALAAQKEAEAKKLAEARKLEEIRKQEEARKEEEAKKLAQLKKEEEAKKAEEARKVELTKKEEDARKEEERKQAQIRKEEEAKKVAQLKKEEEGRRIRLEVEALKRAEEMARMQAEAKRAAEEAAQAKKAAERQRAEAEAAAQRDRERLARKEGPVPAPGALSGLDLAAKALEQLRNPGALKGDPAGPPTPGASVEKPRRRSIIGVERDVSIRMYVDSWRWKIERGGALNYRPSAGMRARENPIVTVSIRSDGTLEEIHINRSSGVRELDQAIRRITELNAPYAKFPPDLARQYDVIEIRRVWFFDDTLKILDEM